MSADEILEAVTAAEVVSPAGETAVSVDLSVVSQQLDCVAILQAAQFFGQWVLIGCIVGVAIALIFRGFWK